MRVWARRSPPVSPSVVASDGGIFAFGDAAFAGWMGDRPLSKPFVGMVRCADGYLMVGADGGILDFSSAPFLGSLGEHPPPARSSRWPPSADAPARR